MLGRIEARELDDDIALNVGIDNDYDTTGCDDTRACGARRTRCQPQGVGVRPVAQPRPSLGIAFNQWASS
jgi:hypothetical protein